MKRIIAFLLVVITCMNVVACGNKTGVVPEKDPKTVGEFLLFDFMDEAKDKDETIQEIAEDVCDDDILPFEAVIMPVEPGMLMGFDNAEITGFKSGVTFAPMISTIPFLGYIFELDDSVDVDTFKSSLEENANLRWNICTEAEELIVENVGNKVFFLMCPKSFDEPAQ